MSEVSSMADIERDPDAKPTTDAMTSGERQRMWKDVYKRERDRFEQERDEARDQLRGAVEALEAAQGEAYIGALADGDPLRACHEVMQVCAAAAAKLRGR